MPFTYQDENGNEIEAYTKEEVQAQIAEKEQKIVDLEQLNKERGLNFTKFSDLNEEQKKAYDSNTLVLMQQMEKESEEKKILAEKLDGFVSLQKESQKKSIFMGIHGGDESVKTILEEKYAMLNMPEETPEQVQARALEASKLAGISISNPNPIFMPMNGEAPKFNDKKEFVETDTGKDMADQVRQTLNIKA